MNCINLIYPKITPGQVQMGIQGLSSSDWLDIRRPSVGCVWLAHTARAIVESVRYGRCVVLGIQLDICTEDRTITIRGRLPISIRSMQVQRAVSGVRSSSAGPFLLSLNGHFSINHSSAPRSVFETYYYQYTKTARIVNWLLSYFSRLSAPASKIGILSHTRPVFPLPR